MDGDLADVAAMSALCRRHDAVFVLDEAHAIGTVGPEGRGLAAEVGVVPDEIIGTFGKALGSFGVWNRARSLVFSTGLPPSVPAASRAALDIVRGTEGDDRRRMLAGHARRFRQLVGRAGGAPASAIAPILIGDDRAVMACTERLLGDGLFVQGIRPPTVPVGTARLRVGLSAGHSAAQLDGLVVSLDNAMRQQDSR
jgi:7-keto-8-aminopelargonate synthetase-like enzyme